MKTKINPHDLSLTISLRKEDQNRMQLVYASQLYGTFFAVFGAFKIDYTDENALKLKGVWLRLINYKGSVNIGIVGVSKNIDEEGENQDEIVIHFKVQALHGTEVLKYYKFKNAKIAKNNTRIIFQRELLPMHNTDAMSATTGNGVFDNEFYDRDGLYVRQNDLRMDDENEEDWTINKHTGRRYKESCNSEPYQGNMNNYDEGTPAEYEDLKDDDDKNRARFILGGRCPKALSIAKY